MASEEPLVKPKAHVPFKYYSCESGVMLICICLVTFGSYWVYDIPGAIYYALRKWFGHDYDATMNLNLYSVYSWPNTVLAFFGGFIVDKISARSGTILFCTLVMTGQLLFAIGAVVKIYWVCLAGRFIFGLGGESLTVAQNTYILRWFAKGPSVALVFGIVLSFVRLGSAINFAVTPTLATSGVPLAMWVGTGCCVMSFTVALIGGCFDRLWDPILKKREEDQLLMDQEEDKPKEEEQKVSLSQVRLFPLTAWLLFLNTLFFYCGLFSFLTVASDLIQNQGPFYNEYDQLPADSVYAYCADFNQDPPSHYSVNVTSQAECESYCSAVSDCSGYQISTVPKPEEAAPANIECYFFTTTVLNISHATYVPSPGGSHYVTDAEEEGTSYCYKRGHQFSPTIATLFLALPSFVAIFGSPLCGSLIDRFGRAMFFIMGASCMLMLAHLLFLGNQYEWWFIHPIPLMIWIGCASSMGGAALWPTLALIVPKQLLGTGYGAMTSVQNFGLAVYPLMIGVIQDAFRGSPFQYSLPLIIFSATGGVSFSLALIAFLIDRRSGHGFSRMNASAAERAQLEREETEHGRMVTITERPEPDQ